MLKSRTFLSLRGMSRLDPGSVSLREGALARGGAAALQGRSFTTGKDADANSWMDEILEQNKKWANNRRVKHPEFFKNLATSQKPDVLWIGCSDARVPANTIMGKESGTVFVQRNIANQVLAIDTNVQSVIQFAVEFLEVPHIVVCGHYDCGGVRAALRNMNHGAPLENWLRNIRDVHRTHREEISLIPEGEARVRRLVELNVLEQCLNVYKTEAVQKRRWATKNETGHAVPHIHGVVYDVANGELKKLEVNLKQEVVNLQECYNLYDFNKKDEEDAFK
mmetsp:Transcript_67381/g.161109  ORF Transcript_67381/g.161109 Transcript_67381/m.161109 type:complete len:279 (-) Transcript_67381:278-1114(-)